MKSVYSISSINDSYLMHHGILGQKWGVRRYQNSDGSLTLEGKERYGAGNKIRYGSIERYKFKDKPEEIELTPVKTKEKVGSFIAGLGILGVSAAALSATGFYSPYAILAGGALVAGGISEGVKSLKMSAVRRNLESDPDNGFLVKNKDKGEMYDLKHCNPGYSSNEGGRHNCACCSIAFDLRRRGYEVTAKQTKRGLAPNQIQSMYKNPKVYWVTDKKPFDIRDPKTKETNLTKEVQRAMNKEPDDTRGIFLTIWSDGYSGHAVAYEKKDGQVNLMDAQSGEKVKMSDYTNYSESVVFFRTDNLQLNNDQIKKVVG